MRPIAIAAYLHGLAAHELTHLDSGRLHANGHDERYVAAREDLGAATGHLLPAMALLVQKVLGLPETAEQKKVAGLEKELEKGRQRLREARAKARAEVPSEHETASTRLRWTTLGEWVVAWYALQRRRQRTERFVAEGEHLRALDETTVRTGSTCELDDLEEIIRRHRAIRRLHPALREARARPRSREERLVEAVERVMRERPPKGVEELYVAGFFARNRRELVRVVGDGLG